MPAINIPKLPAHVRQEARTLAKIPKSALTGKQLAKVLVEVRRSEVRKRRALADAVRLHDKARLGVAKKRKRK